VALNDIFPTGLEPGNLTADQLERSELTARLTEQALEAYERREADLGEELMRALERYLLLQIIDRRWREHLYDMDYLREGIHLRGFAQIQPIVAYKNEAFTLFTDLMNTIWADFARMIFHVEVEVQGRNGEQEARERYSAPGSGTALGRVSYSGGGPQQPSALATAAAGGAPATAAAPSAGDGPPPAEGNGDATLNRAQRRAVEKRERRQKKR
jgi:preprotein translocase subunit SecA